MRYAFDSSTIWLVVCRLFVIGGDLGLPRNIRSWIALTEFVKGSIIIDTWFCGIYRYHGLFCGPIWISIGYESAQQLTASMPASPRVLAVNRYRYGPINLCAHLLQFPNALQFLRATVIWQNVHLPVARSGEFSSISRKLKCSPGNLCSPFVLKASPNPPDDGKGPWTGV